MPKKSETKIKKATKAPAEDAATRITNDPTAAAFFGPAIEESLDKGETFDRKEQIEALISSLNKQFKGGAIIRQGSDIANVFVLRRPTGITTLDISIGGGIPAVDLLK